jgi:hypothetical protein
MQNAEMPHGPLAQNTNRIARLDIPGGSQVVVQDGYAYIGHIARRPTEPILWIFPIQKIPGAYRKSTC